MFARRRLVPAAAVLLLSCMPSDEQVAAPPTGEIASLDPTPAAPVSASSWSATVRARIANEGRAIALRDGAYRVTVGGSSMLGEFDDEGVRLADRSGSEIAGIRTSAWGRGDLAMPVEPVEPALGDCIADLDVQGKCLRRLEYAREGMTEWWVGLGHGVEQGWTFAERVEGDAPLWIEVAVDGARDVRSDGRDATIVANGRELDVGAVEAWDASGEPLPAWIEALDDGLVIRVDDAGAVYPVTVDPTYGSPGTTLEGETANDEFGVGLAGAGDIDGDGFHDLAVGAPPYDGGTGRVYVFLGSATGLASSASTALDAVVSGSAFGNVVAGGDFTGDGYADLAVVAPLASSGSGAVHVFTGGPTGISSSASSAFGSGGEALSNVAIVESVDGDPYGDILVTASGVDAVYVFPGSPSGPSLAEAELLEPGAAGFGDSLAGAGDVNGDGIADVVVGAPETGTDFQGAAFVYLGSATGLQTVAAATIVGSDTDEWLGYDVAGPGDLDDDGYDDIAVATAIGEVQVFHGSATGIAATPSTTISADGDFTPGPVVAGAGDVDGDGYADLLVASLDYGEARVYRGDAAGLDSSSYEEVSDPGGGAYFGFSVAGAGDVDADGYDDIAIADPRDGAGFVYVYGGGPTDADGDGIAEDIDCDDSDDTVGAPSARFVDADGDGYGSTATADACPDAAGYSDTDDDCNDADPAINPGATEVCDPEDTDEDCNELSDDLDGGVDPSTQSTFYEDADSDGYGDVATAACDLPAGHVLVGDDCNDADPAINPGATEVCDAANTDEDCDGSADNNDSSADDATKSTFYNDEDGDGYGDPAITTTRCDLPGGYADNAGDCNDSDFDINPSATEVCNGLDDDCDSLVDDDDDSVDPSMQSTFYEDADSDGYGSVATAACDIPAGHVLVDGDCDDDDAAINPDATEVCDSLDTDEDCDGFVDDADDSVDPASGTTYYMDADGDGYGDDDVTTVACAPPAGFAAMGGDCDDSDVAYNPGAPETDCADPNDYNCDGSSGYTDGDGDGYAACEDCDDSDSTRNPGVTEIVGDSIDSDCDGMEICYADLDDDGYTEESSGTVISADSDCDDATEAWAGEPTGDCDDTDPDANPGGIETPADGDDGDCDGTELCYVDLDDDGYTVDDSTVVSSDLDCSDAGEATAPRDGDCDDEDEDVNPGADEVCNGIDDDCNRDVDDDAVDAETWHADADGDGFTDANLSRDACEQPDGYAEATDPADCADDDPDRYPGNTDVPGDGIDQDCNGVDATAEDTAEPDIDDEEPGVIPEQTFYGGRNCGCAAGSTETGVGTGAAAALALGAVALLRRRREPPVVRRDQEGA